MLNLDLKYLVDAAGKPIGVILQIEQYEELLEDLSDLAAMAESRDEPRSSHAEVIARLQKEGLLETRGPAEQP
jgi:hypothetical protein